MIDCGYSLYPDFLAAKKMTEVLQARASENEKQHAMLIHRGHTKCIDQCEEMEKLMKSFEMGNNQRGLTDEWYEGAKEAIHELNFELQRHEKQVSLQPHCLDVDLVMPSKRWKKYKKEGWENSADQLSLALDLGFGPEEKPLFDTTRTQLASLGFPMDQHTIPWLRSVDFDAVSNFPSVTAYHVNEILESSSTKSFALSNLLELVQQLYSQTASIISQPNPNYRPLRHQQGRANRPTLTTNWFPMEKIANIKQLHELLCEPPLSEMYVSNLEGGIVESIGKRSAKPRKATKKQPTPPEPQPPQVKPLIDLSPYAHLNSEPIVFNQQKMNQRVLKFNDARDLESLLTASWTRFEAFAKKLWTKTRNEPHPQGKGATLELTDNVCSQLGLSSAVTQRLQVVRMIRNQILHGEEHNHTMTNAQVKAVLSTTEQIITTLA
jgi:hypothetical protein